MKSASLLAGAFALTALLVACDNGGDASPGVTESVEQDVTVSPKPEPGVCQPNPNPVTPEFQVIDQPSSGKTVTSPVTISGRIVANEATFQVTIYNANGDPLVDTFGMSQQTEPGQLAPFSIDVAYSVSESTPACIWVYELSAQDGSQINVGQIPVILSP